MTTARKFGLDFVGDIPWGTHLCQFYETKHDLTEILVPYFAEGLRNNEACMWVTSKPLGVEEATASLEKVIPNIDLFIKNGQLFILPYKEWYLKGGTFDADRVLQGWVEKEQGALSRGFEGLRLTGNTFWIERDLWDSFTDYEEAVNNIIGAHRMIAVCTYSLEKCSGSDVTDVIRNHGGTIIKKGATWSVVEDVMHRKEAEVALAGKEQKYRDLVENAQNIILTVDTDGIITFINEYGANFFGYTVDELIGKHTTTIVPEIESMGRSLPLLIDDIVANSNNRAVNINENITKDGRLVWVNWVNKTITDVRGCYIGHLAIGNDVTEQKRAEENAERLMKFPEENPNPVMRLSAEGEILYANKPGKRLLENWNGSVGDAAPQPLRDAATDALSDRQNKTIEISIRSHVFEFFVAPIIDSGYVNFYGRDITERKRAEKELQRAHEEVQALNEELQSTNEELRSMNETLEERVQERTLKLQNEIEERKVVEEELRATSEELQDNVEELRRAEQSVQEHVRTVDILNRVIRAGNEADELQTMLSSMLDTAVELMGFDGGTIYSLNEAQHSIELQYQRGYPPEFVRQQLQHVSLTQKNIARIYKEEPLFSEDYVADAVEGFNPGDIIARAAIPLIARDSVIGHYTLFSRRPRRFTPEERELLVTLGREAATVIAKMQAEEDVKEQLRIIDLANEAIILRDLDHHALSWNKGAERIFGWTRAEAIGQHVSTLLQTEFPVSFDDTHKVLLRDGHWEGEMQCTTKNGARIVLYGSWTLNRDDEGNPTAILSIGNNITERKKAEEQLRAASLYSRNLLEASLDPLVTISAEGNITDVNKATEGVTGLSRKQLIGSDFSNYFTRPRKARRGYEQVFEKGFVWDYPLAIRHTSGKITDVLYNATVYRDESGEVQGVFAAARDVTERKKAQEALKRAHDELDQKVKERTSELQEEIEERKVIEEELRETTEELTRSNKELEQFAYIASHDLQEPLRTVSSAIGLLEQGYKDKLGTEADMFINYAVDGAKHMQQLIKDLLAYSRVTSRGETFTPVSCEVAVQHAIDNLKTAIEEDGVKIKLPEKTLPVVMGDKTQLIQLFQNLIGNAIKFRSEQSPEVQIDALLDEGRNAWQFSVMDNGIGIDMQYGEKIFTIFERLHTTEQYPGTGLGLALCKKIVERHNGKIWVDSKLGLGSTFYFTLPFYVE